MKKIIFCMILVLGMANFSPAGAAPRPGDPAPDFSLVSITGEKLTLTITETKSATS